VIYNFLVTNYNDPSFTFCQPWATKMMNGNVRKGFRFDLTQNAKKKLAELYAFFEKGLKLDSCDLPVVLKEDLYECYFRSFVDHLEDYFDLQDKVSFSLLVVSS